MSTDRDAAELFGLGRTAFRKKLYEEACDLFSRALEKKTAELDSADPVNFELSKYYLWYGDALLTKEENTNQLFSDSSNVSKSIFTKSASQADGSDLVDADAVISQKYPETAPSDAVGDDQLAFELLQLAVKSYNLGTLSEEDVGDLSHCHMRLGDMLMMQNNFSEASEEYQLAVDISTKHNRGNKELSSCYLSLAQSQMFSGHLVVSKMTFKTVESLLEEVVKENPDDEAYSFTLEDVKIQINDLNKLINDHIYEVAKSKGIPIEDVKLKPCSQVDTVSLLPTTTSTLDKSQLKDAPITIPLNECKSGDGGNTCNFRYSTISLPQLYTYVMLKREETVWNIVHDLSAIRKNKRNSELSGKNVGAKVPPVPLVEIRSSEMQLLLHEPCRIVENIYSNQIQPFEAAYKRTKSTKWSDADTNTFYRAIEMFGSDLLMVNGMLPQYTAKQIHIKFKNEEKKSPERLKEALTKNIEINISSFEKINGKITPLKPKKTVNITEESIDTPKSPTLPILDDGRSDSEPVNILDLLL